MKIEKFSKGKNGMYIITFEDNKKIKIHEDLILKYELLMSKQISNNTLEELLKENQIYEIYEITLKYLNIRLRSRKEVKSYLLKKEYDYSQIDTVINMLSNQGYLDDKNYTVAYIHDKILMSSYGPAKIKSELESNGIPIDIINENITFFTEELEKERIEKIVNRQIKQNHNKGSIVLKRKIQTYLINLGYSRNLINQSLNGKKLVDEDIYTKEYEKLYNKLSKKYSGKELEYKLKQKMYQKGFSNSNFE